MERFEQMCKIYLEGSDSVKEIILNQLDEEQRQTFLKGVSWYKLFTQPDFYEAVRDTVSEMVYEEFNR